MTLDVMRVRATSLAQAAEIGIEIPGHLPLLEPDLRLRGCDDVVCRLLAMHAVAASAYGLDMGRAFAWLDRENSTGALTEAERAFLMKGRGPPGPFRLQIEGMWALAWALQIVRELDFEVGCSSNFASMLPDLRRSAPADDLRKSTLRPVEEVVSACDLAFCLHWAVVENHVTGSGQAGELAAQVIVERRRALEWLLCDQAWDEISLDT